jgi:hypothetical protein
VTEKESLLAECDERGIPVDDSDTIATLKAKIAADDAAKAQPPVPVDQFAVDASLSIPVAGLLADNPHLRTAQLTPQEWQARLDAYLDSPRP